ncbi:MAG: 2-polyprenyl-3-methyl-6-methoxy-1,4-benzoquinone monooxygenase [Pseudomonadota bacterium]
MEARRFSMLDELITVLDEGVRTVFGPARADERTCPADAAAHAARELDTRERAQAERLMRVNHAGEVAAQALYRGHALSAHDAGVRAHMERAAQEENDHLAWCARRIEELGGRTSVLNPLWYAGSFVIGALAGRAGDKWSLGFVAETEHQVVRHLDEHLARLPRHDERSRAILEQMRRDEANHATVAIEAGAAELPQPVKTLMNLTSKIMTRTAYWV